MRSEAARSLARLIGYLSERELGYSARMTMRTVTAKDICRLCAASEKFKEQYDAYDRLFAEPMLIIDDLGQEPAELMVYGMIHTPVADILAKRYELRLMTVVTTNLDADELRARYGGRLYDRFREMLTPVVFDNDSYRGR